MLIGDFNLFYYFQATRLRPKPGIYGVKDLSSFQSLFNIFNILPVLTPKIITRCSRVCMTWSGEYFIPTLVRHNLSKPNVSNISYSFLCQPSLRGFADKDYKERQLPSDQQEYHTKGIYKMREERFVDINAGEW